MSFEISSAGNPVQRPSRVSLGDVVQRSRDIRKIWNRVPFSKQRSQQSAARKRANGWWRVRLLAQVRCRTITRHKAAQRAQRWYHNRFYGRKEESQILGEVSFESLSELIYNFKIIFFFQRQTCIFSVTSSEKVDKEGRYADFTLISLPYPGCEFFKEFRENDYLATGLVFDWSQTYVDAEIGVPEDHISGQLRINWDEYQLWDLVKLTQNYLKLILRYLNDSSSGMLIHCISGTGQN